jgi:hypothetical protein
MARLTRRFGPDAQHLDLLVPTLLDGVVVDPALGLDAPHLDPIVPTLPDGAAVDPALDLDVGCRRFSPTCSSWPSPSSPRSKFTLDMLSVAATTAYKSCKISTLARRQKRKTRVKGPRP